MFIHERWFFYICTDANPSTLEVEPKRLPTNLNESVAALENNFMLKEILGEKLVDAILAVRKVC